MNRRELLGAAATIATAALTPSAMAGTRRANHSPPAGDDPMSALMLRLYADEPVDPQGMTAIGRDTGSLAALRHQLDDRSAAVLARKLGWSKTAIAAMEALDPAALSPDAQLFREVFLFRERARLVGPERFGIGQVQRPFVLTHKEGAYIDIPEFLTATHPIRDRGDATAYLDRVRAFATALDQDSDRQAGEARRGYLAPGFVLDVAVAQLGSLRAPPPRDHRLTRSLVGRTGTIPGDWENRCAAILERDVYPALDRQIALLHDLRAGARRTAGVWDTPDGDALYAAALQNATTLPADAAGLHASGLRDVATVTAQLDALLATQGLRDGPVSDRLAELSRRAGMTYPDTAAGRAELLRDARTRTDAMRARLAALFRNPPDQPLRIEPAPPELASGASDGNYFPAAANGSTPARLRVNLASAIALPRYELPAFFYHEGIPGHHLQKSLGPYSVGRFTAYSEGWALYAEQLADEVGGYATPLERIGFLESRLYRAARLVVDTGIHARRWDRDRAVTYLVAEGGRSRASAEREVDRYCIWPGQACSYMVGYRAWRDARERAKDIGGARFDIRAFHDILREGELPLPILERRAAERARAMT